MLEEQSRSTRRGFLQAGAATVAAASGAGCFGTMPPLGGRVAFGRVDAPGAGPATYRRWIPAPGVLNAKSDEDDTGDTDMMYARPSELESHPIGQYFDFPRSVLKSSLDYFGVGFDGYDEVIAMDLETYVLRGTFERSTVAETVTDSGYQAAESYRGYDRYERSDLPRVVAVGDSTVVFAKGENAGYRAETAIDAGRGAVERYRETDQDFADVTAAAGDSPWVWFGVGGGFDPTDKVSSGAVSARVDAKSLYWVYDMVYPDGTKPPIREIRRQIQRNNRAQDAMSVEVIQDGQHVTVEMRLPGNGVRDDSYPEIKWPQITWGVEYDRGAGTLTIRHEAGESVDAGKLSVKAVEFTEMTGRVETGQQFGDEYDTVGPGDSLTVELGQPEDEDASVQLVYQPRENRFSALLDYHVNET